MKRNGDSKEEERWRSEKVISQNFIFNNENKTKNDLALQTVVCSSGPYGLSIDALCYSQSNGFVLKVYFFYFSKFCLIF